MQNIKTNRNNALTLSIVACLFLPLVTGFAQSGCWHMDEASGITTADSCGTSSGNLSNGPVWVAGVSGSAIAFNGTNQFVQLTQPVIGRYSRYTIEAWVKFSLSGPPLQTIYSDSESSALIEQIALRIVNPGTNSGTLQLYTTGNNPTTTSPAPISADAWHFVAVTWRSLDGAILYVDGLSTITNRGGGPVQEPAEVAAIGGYNNYYKNETLRLFKGAIDEVAVFNTNRTPAEIFTDYQRASLQIHPVFSFYAAIGTTYQVQATTNIADANGWTILATNLTVTTIPEFFVDTTAPQPTQRFYRAMPQ